MTGSSISPLSNSSTNLAHSISEDEPCPICRENFGRHSVAVSACEPKHRFHLECISKWFSRLPLTQRKCCICQRDALPLTREGGANLQESDLLIQACHDGDISKIQKILNKEPLLAKGPIYDLKRGELTSPLIVAIANKNLEAAMMLVDAGADINSQYGKDGETALHLAVSKRYIPLIKKLIDSGANIAAKTFDGSPVVIYAAKFGNVKVVRCIVESGADVNSPKNNGITALHYAAADGQTDIVRELLSAGANANARTSKEGMTALHLASCAGHSYTVRELLEKDISNDIILNSYAAALMNGHAAIVKMLINYREIIPKVFLDNYATRDLFRRRRPSLFPSSPHVFFRSTKVKQFIDTFL